MRTILGWMLIGACGGGVASGDVVTLPPSPTPQHAIPQATPEPSSETPRTVAVADATLSVFDRRATAAALGNLASHAFECKTAGGPTGAGHVKVVFNVDGTVMRADVDTPPYQGTPTGECIRALFLKTLVPPYAGQQVTVGKSFNIQ